MGGKTGMRKTENGIRRRKGKGYRNTLLAVVLSGTLALTAFPVLPSEKVQAADNSSAQLRNPVVSINERDTVYFGSYWQKDTNGDGYVDQSDAKTPIRWRILSRNGNEACVIADQILDAVPYDEDGEVTWENCSLRSWLNREFYLNAFTQEEQSAVIRKQVVNDDDDDTAGGNSTLDLVFVPSVKEMGREDYGFRSNLEWGDQERYGEVTEYASARGLNAGDENEGIWWLRTTGYDEDCAAFVWYDGSVDTDGLEVDSKEVGVRPVLYLNLSSSSVSSAGRVESSLKSADWDTVKMGSYGGEPIVWRVLEVSEDRVFLLADRILTDMEYHSEQKEITWKDSSLRKWLNETFYYSAFTQQEKAAILPCSYENAGNQVYGIGGEASTVDFLTLLSMEDMTRREYGFLDNRSCEHEARIACGDDGADDEGYGRSWWLRSPGNSLKNGVFVRYGGSVVESGADVSANRLGVRPAMYVSRTSGLLAKSGSVTVDSTGIHSISFQRNENAQKHLSDAVVILSISDPYYNGQEKKPQETVILDGTVLTRNVDYIVRYSNHISACSENALNAPTVYIEGIGSCQGESVQKTFTILPIDGLPYGAPAETIVAATDENEVADIELWDGWYWDQDDANLQLKAGEGVRATAIYDGDDAENYTMNRVIVTIYKQGSGQQETPSSGDQEENPSSGDQEGQKAHNLVLVPVKAATCLEDGYSAYYTCLDCGKNFRDGNGQQEITDMSSLILPKTGHDWGDWVTVMAATCEENGVQTRTCRHDGTHMESRFVSALGHDYGEWVVTKPATCEENGVQTRTCRHDSTHTQTEPIPALGHDYGEWVVVKQPTASEEGLETRVCKNNPVHVENKAIPKTDPLPGDFFKVDGLRYKVLSLSPRKVEVAGIAGAVPKEVTVKDTVTYDGTKYTITSIQNGAFQNLSAIKTFQLGNKLIKIGKGAFKGCSKSVTIKCSGKRMTAYKKMVIESAKGTVQISGTGIYRITSAGKKTATYIGCTNSTAKSVSVPATVKLDGTSYQVNVVGEGALQNYKKVKTLKIGKNVVRIEKNALTGCDGLKKLQFETVKLKKVQKSTLKKKNLDRIVIIADKKVKGKYAKLLNNSLWKNAK